MVDGWKLFWSTVQSEDAVSVLKELTLNSDH